jgi:hypothetical protein
VSHMVEKSINLLARVLYSPMGYKKLDNSLKSAKYQITTGRDMKDGTKDSRY